MKNKDIIKSEEIKIPELEINGLWKKIINRISHVSHIFWITGMTVFLVILLKLMPYYTWEVIWSSLKAQRTLVILVLGFSLVAVSLVWSIGQRIDVWVFMYFNMHGRRLPWIDYIMLGFTQIGNFIFALMVALILFLRGNSLLAFELILGLLTLGLIVQLMKVLIHRTRPYIRLKNIRIVGSRASGRSFPSGHTSQSFFMATLLLQYYHFNVYGCLGLYAIALLVGITRIYVGMHYPRDVIAGAILGTAWGLLGVIVNSYIFI
ncbi:MAG TPA: phosphatase PAP2 family protein [Clostridiaceae bacterium]